MAKRVASLYAELGMKSDKFKQGASQAKKELNDIGSTISDVTALATAGGLAFAAIGTASQVYQFGKLGAEAIQTGDSFEYLTQKMGAPPDLLEQLQRASRNTVDDLTLMQSTLTLTAGASDKVGAAMLENAPRLLEIAKAANKLNPALGDTTFLYESITSGVKRNSKQILDNLGIVFSQESAYKDYAESIGKTAEQLNDEDKILATLNATMKAGDNLLSQVGGNVDSVADKYARFEVATKNLKTELSKLVAQGLEPVVTVLADVTTAANKNIGTWGKINKALKDGTLSQKEYLDWVKEYLFHGATQSELLDNLTTAEQDHTNAVEEASVALETKSIRFNFLAGIYPKMRSLTDDLTDAEKEAAEQTEKLDEKRRNQNQIMRETIGLYDDQRSAASKLLDTVDRRIESPIANFIEDLKWMMAGGGQFTQTFEAIQRSLERGEITPEQAKKFAEQLFVQVQDFQLKLDDIDAETAAQNVSETLGVSIEEAQKMLDNIAGTQIDIRGELAIAVKLNGDQLALSVANALFAGGQSHTFSIPGGGALTQDPNLSVPKGKRATLGESTGGDTIVINNNSSGAAALTNSYIEERRRSRLNQSMNR